MVLGTMMYPITLSCLLKMEHASALLRFREVYLSNIMTTLPTPLSTILDTNKVSFCLDCTNIGDRGIIVLMHVAVT